MIWLLFAMLIQGADAIGCTGGYFDSDDICHSCPGGKYTTRFSSQTIDNCETCPNGYISNAGDSEATGYAHQDHWEDKCNGCPTSCTICPIGQYGRGVGKSDCGNCTIGKETDAPGALDSSACKECRAGFYQEWGRSEQCKACPAGFYQQERGKTSCSKCPAGKSSPLMSASEGYCFECLPGEQEVNGICTDCVAGKYNTKIGQTTCTDCAAGKYNTQSGQTTCTDCAVGKYNAQTGQDACTACSAGTFNDVEGGNSPNVCIDCPSGKESTTGSSGCTFCPEGKFYFNPPLITINLPYEFPGIEAGETCFDCQPGMYADSLGSLSCTDCDFGKYQDQTVSGSCKSCLPGKMSPRISTSEGDCMDCTAGKYSDDTQCSLCDEGKTSNEGSASASDCVACDTGTYSSGDRICENCELGKFSGVGAATCTDCNVGTYGNETAANSCKYCQKGKYQDETGKLSCKFCTAGRYENTIGNPACKHCGTGRYSLEEGAIVSSGCIPYVENNILDNMEETCSLRVNTSGQGGLTICPLIKEVVRSVSTVSNSLIETTQYTEMTLEDGSCYHNSTVISCFSPDEIACVPPSVVHDGICVDVLENPVRSDLESTFDSL